LERAKGFECTIRKSGNCEEYGSEQLQKCTVRKGDILNWMKKWSFMILWTAAGVCYLTAADGWQVYAKPLQEVKQWCSGVYQEWGAGGDDDMSGNGVPQQVHAAVSQGDSEIQETVSGNMASVSDNTVFTAPEAPAFGQDETPDSAAGAGTQPGAVLPGGGTEQPGAVLPGGGTEQPGDALPGGEAGQPGDALPGGGTEQPGDTLPGTVAGQPQADGGNQGVDSQGIGYGLVEDDYFSDAVFIGDSRTVGMFEYGGLEETAAFYASKGLTIYKMFDAEIVSVPGQKKKETVEQALTHNSFKKIYLMIGINEMGTGTVETFTEAYREAVNHLLELQPDAILYIQGIMKVTTERSEQGDYITNEGIQERNEALAGLADNERIFYLDVNPEICDATGGLEPSYTFDGVHLKAQYIDIWKDYLKAHAVLRQDGAFGEFMSSSTAE